MSQVTGARLVVDALKREGVDTVYVLPGDPVGPSEAANPTLHAAIIDCSGRLGELANRMIESDSANTGTGL